MSATPSPLPSTIAARVEHEIVIKKSRFIATLVPVRSVAAADAEIAALRKRHWDAGHNCTALVVGTQADQQRSSDDGEPAGTAGVPMLEVLRHRHLTDLVAVVTRYFGGVLLGAGGLVRAYSGAVAEALDRSQLVRRERLTEVTLDVPHAEAGRLDNWLREWAASHGSVWQEPVWTTMVRFQLLVPPSALQALIDDAAAFSAGGLVPIAGNSRVTDVPG
ncbi:YigZ family protein [Micropruina sp.]|uniref:YigZ family protein n=1 Tax=Micropruina sp. TaxID=2737536 RepID=UPI0039E44697